MKMGRLLVFALVILISIGMVSSFPIGVYPNALNAQYCEFLSTSTTCGGVVSYQCLVSNTFASPGNTSVTYTFQRADGSVEEVPAQIAQGDSTYGYFKGSLTISALSGVANNTYVLKTIKVSDSANSKTCIQNAGDSNPYTSSGCVITRITSTGFSKSTSCTCGEATSRGACEVNDMRVVTYNPGSQCGGTNGTLVEDCSYCDPQWLLWYADGCFVNNSNYLGGTGLGEYFHGQGGGTPQGQYCCQLTGCLDSNPENCNLRGWTHFSHNGFPASATDCMPPSGSLTPSPGQACQMDAWLGKGKSSDSYGLSIKGSQFGLNYGTPSFFKLDPVYHGVDKIQSLVADVDSDGYTEIVVYEDNVMYKYIVKKDTGSTANNPYGYVTNDLNSPTAVPGVRFFGQPAIFGLSYKDQSPETNAIGVYQCGDGTYPACSAALGIAIFGINLTTLQRQLYVLNGTDFSIITSYLPSTTEGYVEIGEDTGVSCAYIDNKQRCYFTASGNYLWIFIYDPDTNNVLVRKLIDNPLFG